MRLVRIGRVVWEVLAIEDRHGKSAWSQVNQEALTNRHAENMVALITHTLSNGPPRDPQKSKSLRDSILEFRRGPKKGPKLRVLWFYDKGRMIVCTHSFWKDQPNVEAEIDKAVRLRNAYFLAREAESLIVREDETHG